MIYWRYDEKVRGLVIGNGLWGFSITASWRPSVEWSAFFYGTLWILGYDNIDGFVFGWGVDA